MDLNQALNKLGIDLSQYQAGDIQVHSPIDGRIIGSIVLNTSQETKDAIKKAHASFTQWRTVPAPQRGELIRLFGDILRQHKEELGELVTLECGKGIAEGKGEVQEMIDICDFAVGLSRQLYGLTIASERPGHRMMETWHPLGPVATITPFNFPVAVWCWNFALAIVCGDPVVWKPSHDTPFTAFACQNLFNKALEKFGVAPPHLLQIVNGKRDIVETLTDSRQVPLVSATGSTPMGQAVAQRVAARLGKVILELGGNNAMILTPSADLELATRAIAFAALGTAGQRCTTLRRLIIHRSLHEKVVERLKKIYSSVSIGNPLDPNNLVGPLIDKASYEHFRRSVEQARQEGGTVFGGQRILEAEYPNAYYVKPAVAEMPHQSDLVKTETFSPLMYILDYEDFDQALDMHNDVPQGLSSCIFTNDVREAEVFLSARGSDCGIANVNIGPSGAEIGGAFGGEKDTGGGRESGSDSWRNYMRRATNTINYSKDLPLAQGIQFDVN